LAVLYRNMTEPAGLIPAARVANVHSNRPSLSESTCVACGRRVSEKALLKTPYVHMFRCNSCGSWTSVPRPTVESQSALHDTAEYFEHPYFKARREDEALAASRCDSIFGQIGKVIDVDCLRGERMLDIGCDVGSLLVAAARKYDVTPLGLDVAGRAAEVARSRGLQVFHGTIEQAPEEFTGLKLATAIDILEHATDPSAFLKAVRERLAPGGLLFIQTPNCESIVYQIGWRLCRLTNGRPRDSLERLFPPQHIQYFSRCGLQVLAERAGFQIKEIQTRILPRADIVTSVVIRFGLMGLQAIDFLRRKQILLCAVLRKA
jgi:SAM-dependent methyltransferase